MEALQLARHDERLKAVETQIQKLDHKIDTLSDNIQEIKLLIAETQGKFKGAWWVMAVFGSLGGALASVVMKFFLFAK